MIKKKCRNCYRDTRKDNGTNVKRMKKLDLVAFDMDGVLADTLSSWKYIHDYFKTSNERSVRDYIQGKIDDLEFIKRDASLWVENGKPVKIKRLSEILSDIKLMKGAKETVSLLKKNNIKTAIVSAGLNVLADRVGKNLGIDFVYSNGVEVDNDGFITTKGVIGVKLMYKDETVKKISKDQNVLLENIASVGNSCFDVPMFEITGLGIAFNPADSCVKKYADFVVENKDLRDVYKYLDRYI
mgnify:CR=1 FL=1